MANLSQPQKLFGLPQKQGRWGFVVMGFMVNLCMGANFSWSIFRKPLEALLNIGATESGLPFTFFLGSFVFSTLLASRFLEKLGPRKTMIIGGLIVGMGWTLASFANDIAILAICYGIIGGSGIGCAYGVPIAVSSRWLPEHRGLAVGLTLAGYGLSPLLTAPIASHLITAYGTFPAFRFMGLTIMTLLIACAFFMRFPDEKSLNPETPSLGTRIPPTQEDIRLNPKTMFKSKEFVGLYLCYFLAALAGPMAIGISSPVAQEIILLPVLQATAFVSIFAIFNATGRTVFGYLADSLTPRYASALSFAIILAASIGMLSAGPGDVARYAICFEAFWLTMGGWIAIAPAATMSLFGSKFQIKNYGFVFTAYGFGGILGILLSGAMKDLFGSYLYAFYPTAAISFIGIIISLLMLKPRSGKKTLSS